MAIATTLARPCDISHAGAPDAAEQVVDAVGEHVLAVHPQAEAGGSDAELRRRDVPILKLRIAQNLLDRLRQPIPARGARVDRGARRPHDRELGGDEDPVQKDQAGDDQERGHCGALVCGL